MATYNGHKNWNHWNVSLWFHNDEGLYGLMREYVKQYKNKDEAAKAIIESLKEIGITKTPDGAPYTLSSVRAALRDE